MENKIEALNIKLKDLFKIEEDLRTYPFAAFGVTKWISQWCVRLCYI